MGTPETITSDVEVVPNLVGGEWVHPRDVELFDVYNPATAAVIARTPLSGAADVDAAVTAAGRAFHDWRETPVVLRARILMHFHQKLEQHLDELVRLVTTNQGKTLAEARGSLMRTIENVEVACAGPSLLMGGYGLENVGARGVDSHVIREPLGVCAIITPFNFPAMVPMMFLPYALVAGNTVVVKPSEQVPLLQRRLAELLMECDLPPGVLNIVNGGRHAVETLCDHPDVRAVSFVGSSPVARAVYQRATSTGKRAQCFGGAKNLVVVMPDVDLDRAMQSVTESFFVCAGQRCLAASLMVPVGRELHRAARERMVELASSYHLGDGSAEGTTMGPVVTGAAHSRVNGMIDRNAHAGVSLALDGRGARVADRPDGFFIGPTIFDNVTTDVEIGTEEVFGPVAAIAPVRDLEDAFEMMRRIPKANAAAIFTSSGKVAREFTHRAEASMVGVNIGVPAPMAYFPFGGAKDSFFGDIKAHGHDGFDFFTQKKQIIYRWI